MFERQEDQNYIFKTFNAFKLTLRNIVSFSFFRRCRNKIFIECYKLQQIKIQLTEKQY